MLSKILLIVPTQKGSGTSGSNVTVTMCIPMTAVTFEISGKNFVADVALIIVHVDADSKD